MSGVLDDTGKPRPASAVEPDLAGRPEASARAVVAARRWARSHAIALAGLPLLAVTLFVLYLHQAMTQPLNADGSSNALQAWDMLHGNLLLSHWSLTDVTFYLTELPEYMLVEALHGLDGDVVAISAAITYTLVVLLACVLARGRAAGREAFVRVLIVIVVMVAPTAGPGTIVVLSSPDHFGTAVPLVLVYLVYERFPRRWYRLVLLFLLLAWAGTSDSTALLVGGGGIAGLCALRLWRGEGERRPQIAEFCTAVLAVIAGVEVPRLIHQLGGYLMRPPSLAFTGADQMATSFWDAIGFYLRLFAADFFGMPVIGDNPAGGNGTSAETVITLLHLSGAALVTFALFKSARRLARDGDQIVRLLTIGLLLNLAAFVFSTEIDGGAREIAVVLPLGAALAGRVFGSRIAADRRLVATLGALAVVFSGVLVYHASRPSAPADASGAEIWLKTHGYTYGLGGYWNANNITVASGGAVQVRPLNTQPQGIVQYVWDSSSTWYDPGKHYADFIVFGLGPGSSVYARPQQAVAQFGPPVRTVQLPGEEIMIWNKNLLAELPAR